MINGSDQNTQTQIRIDGLLSKNTQLKNSKQCISFFDSTVCSPDSRLSRLQFNLFLESIHRMDVMTSRMDSFKVDSVALMVL